MPDFNGQFCSDEQPFVYMGGTAMSCGQHPSLPRRHRWGPWKQVALAGGIKAWERMCLTCALMSDMEWRRPRSAPHQESGER